MRKDGGKPPETGLAKMACRPCEVGTPPLAEEKIAEYRKEIPSWQVVGNRRLFKKFPFEDFKTALAFVNKIGAVAEAEGHHPDIALTWGEVGVTLFTHAAGGLSENDFILAAKIDEARQPPNRTR